MSASRGRRLPRRPLAAPLVLAFLLVSLALPARTALATTSTGKTFSTLDDFDGASIGYIVGSTTDQLDAEKISDIRPIYYDDLSSRILALRAGSIDAASVDLPVAQLLVAQNPDFAIFPETIATYDYGFGLAKDSPLTPKIREVVERLKADGTIDALYEKWTSGDEDRMVIDMPLYTGYDAPNGTIRFTVEGGYPPHGLPGRLRELRGLRGRAALHGGQGAGHVGGRVGHEVLLVRPRAHQRKR